MIIRLTQLDGKLPNLALMRLAILFRFNKMVDRGIKPYPMVFDAGRRDLKAFQRWAVTGLYRACAWEEYRSTQRGSVVHLSNSRWKKEVSADGKPLESTPHG